MESRFNDLIENSKISSENHDIYNSIEQLRNGKFIYY
jgi:hypothetical protein